MILQALENTFVLACGEEAATFYRVIGWVSQDGVTFQPVAQAMLEIDEREAVATGAPLAMEWDLSVDNNIGAQVIPADDTRTIYHVVGADPYTTAEERDLLRAQHYGYDDVPQRVRAAYDVGCDKH